MRYFALTALSLTLAGCQTAPPLAQPECPVIEKFSCPACEVQQCPEPAAVDEVITACEPVPQVQCETTSVEEKNETIGEVEWAYVEPGDLALEARIDTGAATSSIHAEDIRLVEKDGKRWVQFSLTDPTTNDKISLERRLHRRILVKQKGEDVEDRRYVVRMWITLGNNRTWIDVSLSDRDDYEFPLLLGRNMLMDHFVVDVSKHHTMPKPTPESGGE